MSRAAPAATAKGDHIAKRIFDLVDARKLGQAEGVVETAIAQFPQHHAVRAAEALVLLKSGSRDRAREKAEELSLENVTDSAAVKALIHVLQQLCSWEALARTYERLVAQQDPKKILENLFQTYVRMKAFTKSQSTAVRLFREFQDPKYQVWVVLSILANRPVDSDDTLPLQLAARLLSKSVLTEKGVLTTETTRVYVDVLLELKSYEECIEFLTSAECALVGTRETRLELLFLALRGKGDAVSLRLANGIAKELWCRASDNWKYIMWYLDTIALSEGEAESTPQNVELQADREDLRLSLNDVTGDRSYCDALALAKSLQDKELLERPRKVFRGPFLAELEIRRRMKTACDGSDVAVIVSYATCFASKPCCFLDLCTFIDAESAAALQTWLAESVSWATLTGAGCGVGAPLEDHQRAILAMKCDLAVRSTDAIRNEAELGALLKRCLALYHDAAPLSAGLAWSEEGHCDGYIMIALNACLRQYHGTGDLRWIVAGLAVLSDAERRLVNPGWLIVSVFFHHFLGLVDQTALDQLDFKSMQLDSMVHVGYWPLMRGLALPKLLEWNTFARSYYLSVPSETSLLRAKVFIHGSWPVMKDLMRFEAKMHFSLARLESVLHFPVLALSESQTQRDAMATLEEFRNDLFDAWCILSHQEDQLVDNCDQDVIKAQLIGNVNDPAMQALAASLANAPTKAQRVRWMKELVSALLLLCDVSALENHRQALAKAPRQVPKSGNAAAAEIPPPQLLCKKVMESQSVAVAGTASSDRSNPGFVWSPVWSAIAPDLLDYVLKTETSSKKPTAVVDGDKTTVALGAALAPLTSSASSVQEFLFPDASLLSCLTQVGSASALPVARWSKLLLDVVSQMEERVAPCTFADSVDFTLASACDLPLAKLEASLKGLAKSKKSCVQGRLSDLKINFTANSRRK